MNPGDGMSGEKGLTLIELIIAIVVVGIGMGGVLLAMNHSVSHSADPMVQHQAVAIAEAYLEEILLKPVNDPGGGPEGGRADFDNVGDYHGLSDAGARNQDGVAIPGLGAYTVTVEVAATSFGTPGVPGLRVQVRVSHPGGVALALAGYRTDY